MFEDHKVPGPSGRVKSAEGSRLSGRERHITDATDGESPRTPNHPGYYRASDETGSDDDSRDDEDDEHNEILTARLRKPMLSLSEREKNDICRYKTIRPESSIRQVSEHFTQLWNKIVCRRSIYDVLIQSEKWTCVENRAYQDTEFTSEDPVEDIENLLYDWITEILRAEARVWDEDVRKAAANIRDIRSLKGFMPSPTWLNDFKCRHRLEVEPSDGSIIARALEDIEGHPSCGRKRQIRIDIGDGLSYQIDVDVKTTIDAHKERIPPHSQFAGEAYVRRGGPNVPPNRMSDFQLSDSGDEDEGSVNVGLLSLPRDHCFEALLGVTASPSFHDVLKHLVYGPSVMSEGAQEMMAACTEAALRAEESDAKRCARRFNMTADLVRKVLEAKQRRDEAEIEMYQEKKLRDLNAFKVAEEKRKRHIERRELHVVQKRILETEEKFFSDQQRNELIRKELLLVEDPIATMDSDSGKKAEALQSSGTPVKRRRAGLATIVGGAE